MKAVATLNDKRALLTRKSITSCNGGIGQTAGNNSRYCMYKWKKIHNFIHEELYSAVPKHVCVLHLDTHTQRLWKAQLRAVHTWQLLIPHWPAEITAHTLPLYLSQTHQHGWSSKPATLSLNNPGHLFLDLKLFVATLRQVWVEMV